MAKRHLPIEEQLASQVAAKLPPVLFDLTDLHHHVKLAHWNLRGVGFIAVHRLLDDVAEIVDHAIDEVAERIRQLGVPVVGSLDEVAQASRLPEFPKGELPPQTAVDHLAAAFASAINGVREALDECDGLDEPITVDLLTKVSGDLEVQMWLIDSNRG